MNPRPAWIGCLLLLLPGAVGWSEAGADVVYLASGEIIYGRLESEQPEHVLFRQRLQAPGRYQSRTLRRDQIRTVVVTVDEARLESLTPGDWQAYLDWAEELAAQQADPEARDLAWRLYLLVARHASSDLQLAGFRGAIAVAHGGRLPAVQALAFQTLDRVPQGLPERSVRDPVGDVEIDPVSIRLLLSALQRSRSGDKADLDRLVSQSRIKPALRPFAGICSWDQLQTIAAARDVSNSSRSRLLRLELALEDYLDGKRPAALTFDSPWSVLVGQSRNPVALINFENVADFDLDCPKYASGQWIPE